MYYPHMPSIVGKRRGQHTYYYLVESARVDGQPRIVSQQYLGTAEEVMARLSGTATGGPRWVKLGQAAVDHRRFWDAMDRLGEADLRRIETTLGRRMVGEFGLDLQGLVLDMTNFATFIDTRNQRAPIAQRGKAKQKGCRSFAGTGVSCEVGGSEGVG